MSTIVIVTSVIFYKNKRLSYSKTRSAFSPDERLNQTKKTIQSVRRKIPNAKIFLFEQGTKDLRGSEIEKLVDSYIFLGENKLVRIASDSLFKGLGEVVGLLFASKYLPKGFSKIFKISGRYYLNDNFNLDYWVNGDFEVKRHKNNISTRLYAFDNKLFYLWKLSLILSIPFLLIGRSIENLMPCFIPKKYFTNIDVLGLSGVIGVDKNWIINE